MGIQSVVTRPGGYVFPTTMVSGTLTLLGMDMAQSRSGLQPDTRHALTGRRIRAYSRVAVAFGVGAALGGLLTAHVHSWALAVPVAAVSLCAHVEATVSAGRPDEVTTSRRGRP